MAKKVAGTMKLQVPAGQANPSPPVGPALGQRGINIMEFCKAFNAKTQDLEPGAPCPTIITYYVDKSFEMDINSKSSVRVIVRDYSYKEGQSDADKEEVRKLEADEKESKKELKRWCISYFSEAYRAWLHLKVKSRVKLIMEIR